MGRRQRVSSMLVERTCGYWQNHRRTYHRRGIFPKRTTCCHVFLLEEVGWSRRYQLTCSNSGVPNCFKHLVSGGRVGKSFERETSNPFQSAQASTLETCYRT